jgi:hypothetical protein
MKTMKGKNIDFWPCIYSHHQPDKKQAGLEMKLSRSGFFIV